MPRYHSNTHHLGPMNIHMHFNVKIRKYSHLNDIKLSGKHLLCVNFVSIL